MTSRSDHFWASPGSWFKRETFSFWPLGQARGYLTLFRRYRLPQTSLSSSDFQASPAQNPSNFVFEAYPPSCSVARLGVLWVNVVPNLLRSRFKATSQISTSRFQMAPVASGARGASQTSSKPPIAISFGLPLDSGLKGKPFLFGVSDRPPEK